VGVEKVAGISTGTDGRSVVKGRNPFHALLDHRFLGGVLIMGQHSRSEALFYNFRLEDQVPETHLLRLIEKHISFAFVRERLKVGVTATRAVRRLIPSFCFASR
jgi:hypothetical protein